MLKQIEGSRAVAEAVAMSRPQVICAYPITPQTHIVEALSAKVKTGQLSAEFLNVESEFAGRSRSTRSARCSAPITGCAGSWFSSEPRPQAPATS